MNLERVSGGRKRRRLLGVALVAGGLALASCGSLPEPKHEKYGFPKEAFLGDVKRPYKVLGQVRTRVDYTTLDPNVEESVLCKNYFNKAAQDLVKRAKKQGADAVIDVQSVVFLYDGKMEKYSRAECTDEGAEGTVLAQGIAVKWKPAAGPSPTPR